MLLPVLVRRMLEPFLKTTVEVGSVTEAAFETDVADIQIRILQKGPGVFEPFVVQPFPGGLPEIIGEVPLKGGEAPAAKAGIFFQFEVIMEVLVHDFRQVGFFHPPQGTEIG